MIDTVLDQISPEDLEWVYPHEHLLICMREFAGESIGDYPGNLEYARRDIVRMLQEVRGYGVNGFADPTPIGIGRDDAYVRLARSVSQATGVHIFLSTGLYVSRNWPRWAMEETAAQIGERFCAEFERGIGETGARPTFLKAAVDGEVGANEEKALTACAYAHCRTGAAVHVHATCSRRAVFDVLTGSGVNPSRIYIAHADMNTSESEFLWLAERGVRLVMTNWDFPYHMDQEEARRLVRVLIDAGHIDKILISIDFALTLESRWTVGRFTWDNPDRTSYGYLHTGVLPRLRNAGISDAELQVIMHDNPIEMVRRK
ncbi:MAG: hypothetical protein BWY06_00455 [Candidatus Latescibacteria bacterium ADurb.Bin168]|nr:MAG: hypothetical protein BWY06_00455 [Candidatus Latescibacteria bacterium ADurb.Bin168]